MIRFSCSFYNLSYRESRIKYFLQDKNSRRFHKTWTVNIIYCYSGWNCWQPQSIFRSKKKKKVIINCIISRYNILNCKMNNKNYLIGNKKFSKSLLDLSIKINWIVYTIRIYVIRHRDRWSYSKYFSLVIYTYEQILIKVQINA